MNRMEFISVIIKTLRRVIVELVPVIQIKLFGA